MFKYQAESRIVKTYLKQIGVLRPMTANGCLGQQVAVIKHSSIDDS